MRSTESAFDSWNNHEYFYVLRKQQQGPADLVELASLFAKGRSGGITGDTLVWCESLVEWTRLKEIRTLLQVLQHMTQQAPEAASLAPHDDTHASPEAQAAVLQRTHIEDTSSGKCAQPHSRAFNICALLRTHLIVLRTVRLACFSTCAVQNSCGGRYCHAHQQRCILLCGCEACGEQQCLWYNEQCGFHCSSHAADVYGEQRGRFPLPRKYNCQEALRDTQFPAGVAPAASAAERSRASRYLARGSILRP